MRNRSSSDRRYAFNESQRMNELQSDGTNTLRARIARAERRVGWLAIGLGALALVSFSAFGGNEHHLVVLALAGLPAMLGGGLLVVAGRMLERKGKRAVAGQLLPLAFAAYWLLLIG